MKTSEDTHKMITLDEMQTPVTLLLCCVLLLMSLWYLLFRRPRGIPPGPGRALPLIGHLHLLGEDPRQMFAMWHRMYGHVFSLYMGSRLVVAVNGFEAVKEALVKCSETLSDKDGFYLKHVLGNKGILLRNGAPWKEQHKLSVRILRRLGVGKITLETKVKEEVGEFLKVIESTNGEPYNVSELVFCSVCNNICSIVFGRRYEYDDTTFRRQVSSMDDVNKALNMSKGFHFFPFLKFFPGDLFGLKQAVSIIESIVKDCVRPQIKNHLNADSKGEVTPDFIYEYIQAIREHQSKGQPTTIDVDNLHGIVLDLFLAGTDTTSSALRWAILLLTNYPDVAEKCYQEIRRVVGLERLPTFQDKAELKYVNATILEVLRWSNIVPIFTRTNPQDATFLGYNVPKRSLIFIILTTAMRDPDVWGDPNNFRPERFLESDRELSRLHESLPFGMGPHKCIGKDLALMEMFLYLTSLIQRFQFLPPDGEPIPPLEGITGITHSPKPFKLRYVPRHERE